MDTFVKIVGFLLGLGAMISLFLIYQQKSRKKLLACKLTADVCWVGHYLTLGAFGGLIPNFVGIFRELTFSKEKSSSKNIALPIFFILLNWGLWALCFWLELVTFASWIEILPILGSCLVTFSLWLKKPTLTKLVSVPVSLSFLTYNLYVHSLIGVINESISLSSIFIFFIKNQRSKRMQEKEPIFIPCPPTQKELTEIKNLPILNPAAVISAEVDDNAIALGERFAQEIADNFVADFKKEGDQMVHVSTYVVVNGVIYFTYYANVSSAEENPIYQRARLAFCHKNTPSKITYLDLQAAGESYHEKTVKAVYDTILMQKEGDTETLYLMWTANLDGNYYRLYRTYHIPTASLGEVQINRLQVGNIRCDFSFSDIRTLFAEQGIGCKTMYSDIGIMQKITSRMENGEKYYYTGAYSGDLNFIIKSKDFITWEYVAHPDFPNESKWENAVYLWEDKCYYFVRQQDGTLGGFLTYYDLTKKEWATPVVIADCQSRSDFIAYNGGLYLFHAPIDREHIGVVRIDTDELKNSRVVFQAKMQESCFYPYIQYGEGELYFSYTMNRKAIKLSKFNPETYLQ